MCMHVHDKSEVWAIVCMPIYMYAHACICEHSQVMVVLVKVGCFGIIGTTNFYAQYETNND